MAAIQDACRRTGVAISLGVSERMSGGGHTLFNSQVTVDSDGTILGVHRKLQPTYVERMVWAQGDGSTLCNFPLAELGWNLGGLAVLGAHDERRAPGADRAGPAYPCGRVAGAVDDGGV